jgi:hypothetical protein
VDAAFTENNSPEPFKDDSGPPFISMSFPLFQATAPPENTLYFTTEPSQSFNQVPSFRREFLSRFDNLDPKISALRARLKSTNESTNGNIKSISAELQASLKTCQDQLPTVRTSAVNVARQTQRLSLALQSAITLEGPRQIRTVRMGFFNLQDQFDSALKNIATLTRSLTTRTDTVQTKLRRLNSVASLATASFNSIPKLTSQTEANANAVQSVRDCFQQEIETTFEKMKVAFEESLHDTEEFIEILNRQASEKLSNSSIALSQIQNEKFDIQTSFDSVITQMQKSIDERIELVRKAIITNQTTSREQFERIQNKLREDLDLIRAEMSDSGKSSLLEDLEYEHELWEVEKLLSDIERITQAIESSNGQSFNLSSESDDDSSEDDRDVAE